MRIGTMSSPSTSLYIAVSRQNGVQMLCTKKIMNTEHKKAISVHNDKLHNRMCDDRLQPLLMNITNSRVIKLPIFV